jgi:hypothetical protein
MDKKLWLSTPKKSKIDASEAVTSVQIKPISDVRIQTHRNFFEPKTVNIALFW